MASEANANHGPVLFWCGVAVAEFGAIQPGFGYPWRPTAYAAAALLVALGFLTVKAADYLRTEEARQRLRLGGYLAGALLVAHQFSSTAYVTGLSRAGSLILYAMAAVMAIQSHHVAGAPRPSLLIATGLDPSALRARLEGAGDTVAVYRTERATDELRDLAARHGVILVEGAEHDPRAKERLSASGLGREIPDIAEREVVVAGPRPFKRYVSGALSRLAVPRSQIHFKSQQRV
ncbi:hypothetical protein FH608_020235 [Nonomuraea phyllanthi]|uniref:Uncharacterized protein n=1 Tax=Nonomuraea phyllanthi TaxID=2219224 RepID=A0A5C4WFG4_9ACTN|nr:hypothetical protein [Nonomuraea phyllanthi]KAB8193556.1 hypothetical protein FH608_020235 [Nonomuraea phyllanthi]QFY12297.1 hypothetical protein GBF35_42140 [Nonomuraea phyllanthi]